MKKKKNSAARLAGLIAATLLAGSLIAGCGMFSKANGIILYGEKQQVEDMLIREKNLLKDNDIYTVKLVEEKDEKRTLVLDDKTAKLLMDKKLIRQVIKGDKTEAISKLPELTDEKGVLFAKEKKEGVETGEKVLPATYGGNVVIGDGRSYADQFLVVTEAAWDEAAGTEKTMGVLHYEKDPSKKMGTYNVEKNQLIQIR
ncbi:lipoprotein BA_5634 family protein [Paenibacillus sp. M.A.Huq-81]